MGINGQYSAVQYPRWLLGAVGLACVMIGAGATAGMRFASESARIEAMQRTDQQISVRVDTLRLDVDALRLGRTEDAKILRALATLQCLDGSPTTLAVFQAQGAPCASLIGAAPR